MSTVSDAPVDMDKLTEEWFVKLRKAIGVRKIIGGGLAVDFQKHYAKLQKHIEQIQEYGGDIKPFQQRYDEMVKAAEQAVEKKSAKDVGKVDKLLVALDKEMKAEKDRLKKELGNFPWEKFRAAASEKVDEFGEKWGTEKESAKFKTRYDKILVDGKKIEGLPKDKLTSLQETTKAAFTQLIKDVQQGITTAGRSKESFNTALDAAEKTLGSFKKLASSEEYATAKQQIKLHEVSVLADNDYETAASELVKLELELAGKVSNNGVTKTKYNNLLPTVVTALEQFEPLASEAIYGRAEEQKLSAERQAAGGDYVKALETLVALDKQLKLQIGTLTKAKNDWEGNALRTKLTQEFDRLTKEYGAFAACIHLPELKDELKLVEFSVTQTSDYARGIKGLTELEQRIKTTEAQMKREAEAGGVGKELQKAFDENCSDVDKMFETLKGKLGSVPPKALEKRYETMKNSVKGGGTVEKVTERFTKANQELIKLAGEIQDIIDNKSGAGDTYVQGEKDDLELQSQLAQYKQVRPKFIFVMNWLEGLGGVFAERVLAKFDLIEKAVATNKLAEVKQAVIDLNGIVDETNRAYKDEYEISHSLLMKLDKEWKDFNTTYDKTVKLLQNVRSKDPCFGIRESLKEQAVALSWALTSEHKETLLDALGKMEELNRKLKDTLSPTGRQPVENLTNKLKEIKPLVDDKVIAKQTKDRSEQLKLAYENIQGMIDTSVEPSKIEEAITQLKKDAEMAALRAGNVKIDQGALEKKLEAIKKQFKQLATAMKSMQGKPGFEKIAKIKGENFGELQTEYDRLFALKETDSMEILQNAKISANQLAINVSKAIADPTDSINGESTAGTEEAEAKESWTWDLNSFLNGNLELAKQAASGHPGIKLIGKYRKEAEKLAEAGDYKAARARLQVMDLEAQKIIATPNGGRVSKNLNNAAKMWKESVVAFKTQLEKLQKAMKDECIGKDGVDEPTLIKLANDLGEALKPLKADAFDKFVETLTDKNQTDLTIRRTARERGLDKVREYQRYVEQDPTFQVLMKNPFSIAIPGGALYRNLRTLDYDLQITT